MDATSLIFVILYTVSTSLLYPVVLMILMFVLWALVSIGEFLSEYSKRHRDTMSLEEACTQIRTEMGKQSTDDAVRHLRGIDQNHLVTAFAQEAAQHLENNKFRELERLFGEYEVKLAARLEKTRIMSTVGPMLGLMGTLIPMGPALIGLSKGDVASLADNLIIAFSTTVLGLFVGSVGYVLTIIRRRWYQYDLEDIEYVIGSILEDT